MKKIILFLSVSFLLAPVIAQPQNQLLSLPGTGLTVYFSEGYEQRARLMAARIENVTSYYHSLLEFRPSVTLLLLSKKDWPLYTKFPVYGMPHYNADTLIVAAEDNELWRSFISVKDLPEEIRTLAEKVYRLPDNTISMQPFFDLLAVHELGHAYHIQGKLKMQRLWMGELFCNILLHTYIAEKEPALLPALTLFPQIVIKGGVKNYRYTSLQELEDHYREIAQQHPQNYGWYQCRWHAAAAMIYDAGGKEVMRNLWNALSVTQTKLDDAALAEMLKTKVSQPVADVMLRWETDMTR